MRFQSQASSHVLDLCHLKCSLQQHCKAGLVMHTLHMRKIRLRGGSDLPKPDSALLLCQFSPSSSSGTSSSLLTVLHVPAPFMACLIQETLHRLALRDLPIPHLTPASLPFSAFHLVPAMIHNLQQNKHNSGLVVNAWWW